MLTGGMKPIHLTLPSLILAIGLATAGYFISETLFKSKVALNTADVKGLAERRVEADLAHWTIGYAVAGSSRDEVPALYKQAEANREKIIALLKQNGFGDEEITPGIITHSHQEYRNKEQVLVSEKHTLSGFVSIETLQVRQVAGVRAKLNALIAEGMNIHNRAPTYKFTKLNDIKPEMLKEATKNARIAANEFASNAGVEVGGIRYARQGGFTVRDVGDDYSDSGKIDKEVRVVTNVTFFLTD